MMEYAVVVTKLSDEDGGGYIAVVPDLYGCMSDGETPEEALRNVQEAISDWLEASKELGRNIPDVGSSAARARAREKAFIDTIKTLTEQLDGLDGRVDRLFADLAHLQELIEHQGAWDRFEKIVGFEQKPTEAPRLRC